MRQTAKGLEYPNKFYWDISRNPYASVLNGLADCTCYCYGAVIEDGHRPIVSRVCNANNYHKYLIDGWSYIPYDESKLEKGDIIEWSAKCHVAVYTGGGNISGSFYTGMHGRAYWDGKFDRYIAGVEGRVTYIPATGSEVLDLKARIAELESKLEEIQRICLK